MSTPRLIPLLGLALAMATPAGAAPRTPAGKSAPQSATLPKPPGLKPCTTVTVDPASVVYLGKTTVLRLDQPVTRMVIGGRGASRAAPPVDAVRDGKAGPVPVPPPPVMQTSENDPVSDVDITLLSPTELFILGKRAGSMNVVMQSADGACHLRDIVVTVDPGVLRAKLAELMPEENGIQVRSAENTIVLTGKVSDASRLADILALAGSYGDGKKIVNLLHVTAPQQVMLEVKIAEVSKTLLDHFGFDFSRMTTSADGVTSRIISGIVGGNPAVIGQFSPNSAGAAITGSAAATVAGGRAVASGVLNATTGGASLFGLDMQDKDGLVRVLAEPNIMAISGQQASFLSGGKIFIPVAQSNNVGSPTITLEEKEFGVGLKFTPTVLDGTRINLKLVSEVSELSQTGSPFTTVGGVTSVLPSLTTRRVDTTVQLHDGQSFAVAGLIRNNIAQTLSRFPGVGDVPVLGALFRSTEFLNDRTELLFVITPRLVKPSNTPIALPTDTHVPPTPMDAILMGKAEGTAPPAAANAAPKAGQAAAPARAVASTPAPIQPPIQPPSSPAPGRPPVAVVPQAPVQTSPRKEDVVSPLDKTGASEAGSTVGNVSTVTTGAVPTPTLTLTSGLSTQTDAAVPPVAAPESAALPTALPTALPAASTAMPDSTLPPHSALDPALAPATVPPHTSAAGTGDPDKAFTAVLGSEEAPSASAGATAVTAADSRRQA